MSKLDFDNVKRQPITLRAYYTFPPKSQGYISRAQKDNPEIPHDNPYVEEVAKDAFDGWELGWITANGDAEDAGEK
jgi:hypothetical protein